MKAVVQTIVQGKAVVEDMRQHPRTDAHNGSIDAELSRMLATVLRHHADRKRIQGNPQQIGSFNLEALLKLRRFAGYTAEDVRRLIDQQSSAGIHRFQLNDDETHIRALQGHSNNVQIDDGTMFRTVDVAEFGPGGKDCIHGTTLENWWSIREYGLHSMGRQHVHFATHTNAIKDRYAVWIYIDVVKASRDGHVRFMQNSANVVLTREIVASEYFSNVYLRGQGKKWYEWHEATKSWRESSPSGHNSSWIVWAHGAWKLCPGPWESDDSWISKTCSASSTAHSWWYDSKWQSSWYDRKWKDWDASSWYDRKWQSWDDR